MGEIKQYQDLRANQRYLVDQIEAYVDDQQDVTSKIEKIEVMKLVLEDIRWEK